MGKYSDESDEINVGGFYSRLGFWLKLLCNELAEANRLKRMEIEILNSKSLTFSDDGLENELEDKA